MPLTKQQQCVVDTTQKDDVSLVKVEAVAGAGKTSTLIALAQTLNCKSGMYLAYNKAIATEAAEKFAGTTVKCSTVHSLAYRAVVSAYGLKVGFFGVRDVEPRSLRYPAKKKVVDAMEELLLSKYVHVQDFFDANSDIDSATQALVMTHLDRMTNGEISCSHSFYLKLYHILLSSGDIVPPETDLLMIDEAGDLTPISLDIFRLINAKKKVMVGDSMQNIYSFNNTINGFEALEGTGISVPLTKSFRVSDKIASRIEGFCQKNVRDDFEFTGREYPDNFPIESKAYIARTNAGLMQEMFRLMAEGKPFSVTRPIGTILELPLILANLGSGKPITNIRFKVLEKHRKAWETEPILKRSYSTASAYVRTMMANDDEIRRGFEVVFKHGTPDLNKLAAYVRGNADKKQFLTLTTAHSSKGLEFTAVEIAPDMNTALDDVFAEANESMFSKKEILKANAEEFRLYYVACSRAMTELINAKHLPRGVI